LPLDADASAVGDAVLSALTASSDAIPHPTDWRAMAMPRLAVAGVRSERAFQLERQQVAAIWTGINEKPQQAQGLLGFCLHKPTWSGLERFS